MKRVLTILLLTFLSVPAIYGQVYDTIRIQIDGMTCSLCSKNVQDQLERIYYIKKISIELNSNIAVLLVDTINNVNPEEMAKAVWNAGFTVGAFEIPIAKSNRTNGIYSYTFLSVTSETTPLKKAGYYTLVGKWYMNQESFKKVKKQMTGMTFVSPPVGSKLVYYY
ncbi:MAG: heavy metal-associated domain-containing protein [Cytophagaceae bacterium]